MHAIKRSRLRKRPNRRILYSNLSFARFENASQPSVLILLILVFQRNRILAFMPREEKCKESHSWQSF